MKKITPLKPEEVKETITLKNDLHETSVDLTLDEDGTLTWGQILRSRRTLCPTYGCGCSSSPLGIRGPQDVALYVFDQGGIPRAKVIPNPPP